MPPMPTAAHWSWMLRSGVRLARLTADTLDVEVTRNTGVNFHLCGVTEVALDAHAPASSIIVAQGSTTFVVLGAAHATTISPASSSQGHSSHSVRGASSSHI